MNTYQTGPPFALLPAKLTVRPRPGEPEGKAIKIAQVEGSGQKSERGWLIPFPYQTKPPPKKRGSSYKEKVFAYIDQQDSPCPVTYQLALLRKVGFNSVELLHKNSCFAAFGAIKTE